MKSSGQNDEELASIIDVTRQYIAMLRRGHARPGLKVAVKIDLASKGAVPITSWV
jgi:DNA-binding XRE family transcriptional regulator